MPRATVNLDPGDKIWLKTCPDGYVILRRLPYGKKLERSQNAARMSADLNKRSKQNTRVALDLMQRESTYFDFRHCIVEHNLEDENGALLNLTSPADVDKLDPIIGEEIAEHIDRLNNFEDDLDTDEGNS